MRRCGGRAVGSGGRAVGYRGRAVGLVLAGLVLVAGCTGGARSRDRRTPTQGASGCSVLSGDGGSWLVVGAVRAGGPPPSIGTPVTGAEGGSGTTGTLAPAVWESADGARWTRERVEPVTLDGAVDRLL